MSECCSLHAILTLIAFHSSKIVVFIGAVVARFCVSVQRFLHFFDGFPRRVPTTNILTSCIRCRVTRPPLSPMHVSFAMSHNTSATTSPKCDWGCKLPKFLGKYKVSFNKTQKYDVGRIGACAIPHVLEIVMTLTASYDSLAVRMGSYVLCTRWYSGGSTHVVSGGGGYNQFGCDPPTPQPPASCQKFGGGGRLLGRGGRNVAAGGWGEDGGVGDRR